MDKFKTCKDCKDRTVIPNCHMTCEGFLYRENKNKEINNNRIKEYHYQNYYFTHKKKKGV